MLDLAGGNSGLSGTVNVGGGQVVLLNSVNAGSANATWNLTSGDNSGAARNKFGSASAGSANARWVLNGTTDSPSATVFGTGTIYLGELSGNAANVRNDTTGQTAYTIGGLKGAQNIALINNNATPAAVALTVGGNTTVTGGTLDLAATGQMKFVIGANHVNNAIANAGTLNLDGSFNLDLSGADLTPGNSWSLVSGTTPN